MKRVALISSMLALACGCHSPKQAPVSLPPPDFSEFDSNCPHDEREVDVTLVEGVKSPGIYRMKANESILDAIERAGGFSNFALDKVILVRTHAGHEKKTIFSRHRMVRAAKSPLLCDGDKITVPEEIL